MFFELTIAVVSLVESYMCVYAHTLCNSHKSLCIFSVKLTGGRQCRRGDSSDGDQTKDQAQGSGFVVEDWV